MDVSTVDFLIALVPDSNCALEEVQLYSYEHYERMISGRTAWRRRHCVGSGSVKAWPRMRFWESRNSVYDTRLAVACHHRFSIGARIHCDGDGDGIAITEQLICGLLSAQTMSCHAISA